MKIVYKQKNRNIGVDSIHREVIKRLDRVSPTSELQIKKIKIKKGSWVKYLIVKNTGERLMLISGVI